MYENGFVYLRALFCFKFAHVGGNVFSLVWYNVYFLMISSAECKFCELAYLINTT